MPNTNAIREIPPELPGSYRILDADGDIRYWGDTMNLYNTWIDKIKHSTFPENGTFEYTSDTSAKSKYIKSCHMSDLLTKKEK